RRVSRHRLGGVRHRSAPNAHLGDAGARRARPRRVAAPPARGLPVSTRAPIACLGAGRMARGIAIAFAYAGHRVLIVDVKLRTPDAYRQAAEAASAEVRAALRPLARLGLFAPQAADELAQRVTVARESHASELAACSAVFEAVPEIPSLKRDVLARVSARLERSAILASTSSTILVEELAPAVAAPGRFLNAHWLNPAFLVPLVEVSPA